MTSPVNHASPVLAKIRKLLALAKSTNPNEAAVAATQAQRLLDEHNLSLLDIDEPEERVAADVDALCGTVDGRLTPWRTALAQALATSNGCVLLSRGGQIRLVGRPTDTAVVRYLFVFCEREIERLTARLTLRWSRAEKRSFRMGVVATIRIKLAAARAAHADGAQAIVLVDRRWADARAVMQEITGGRVRAARTNIPEAYAYRAGQEAGTEIELSQGLGAGQEKRALRSDNT